MVDDSEEYVSFPETDSPHQQVIEETERKTKFFAQFATTLASLPHNYIDLLKMLSDGIADLLFTGSNRLEKRTEVRERRR